LSSASSNAAATPAASSPADFSLSFWVYLNHASQTKATILARSTLVDDHSGHHGARGYAQHTLHSFIIISYHMLMSALQCNSIRMYSPAVTVHDPASGMLRVMVQTSANNEVLNSALAIPIRYTFISLHTLLTTYVVALTNGVIMLITH
jgi:hypothetical protein